jgi:hypothetical protein
MNPHVHVFSMNPAEDVEHEMEAHRVKITEINDNDRIIKRYRFVHGLGQG